MNKPIILCALAALAAFGQSQTPLTITQSAGSATGELRMQERRTNGQNYVGIKAPQSVPSNIVWTLPSTDGTAGQCISTDGSAVLSFADCAGYWTLSGSDIYRSTGVVTIGHTTPTLRLGQNLNTNYAGGFGGAALNTFSAAGAHGSVLDFNKSASGTLGAHGAVSSGDTLGFFVFRGSDGAAFQRASEVLGEVDGTVSSGVVPGRIRFRTANSSGTMTESWRIDKDGAFRPGADDTFSIGLTGTRVLGVYAKFGEFYKSGSTASSDYLTTRKYNILDQSGGSGVWDIQASGSMASTSSIKIRDNAGSRWLEAYRALAGSPLKYTSLFGHLYPAKRLIADGDAVDDSVFGDLGDASAPWANVWGDSANFSALTIPTGSTTGYVWTDTGSGVGAWQPGGLDEYDVRNFGAVCDGTTDDTSAIESAIAAGSSVKHKAILPQGICIVTTINISNNYAGLRGQGRNNSILRSVTNAPIILVDNASPVYYLEFSDLTLKGGDVGTSQTGIESATAGFGVSTIRNVYFDNLYRGVKLGHTTDLGDNNILDNAFSMGGDAVAAAALANGTVYVIGSVGTTDFTLIGAASNTVGLSFTKSGSAGIGTGVAYLESTFSKVGVESLHTSSGSIWSRNFFGGLALPAGATQGPRAFYIHGYVGDTVLNDNHMEGGWIGFDISCDNGTFATGICSYGENLVITGNKIDGYALDFRLYNLHNSTIMGNRGRLVLDAQITGTSTSGMIYDVVGRTDSGSAIERAGWKLTTSTGDTAINAYDEGRIRLGTVTSNLSNTRNGISIQDQGASSAIALGQSTTRNMGMLWNYNATAGSAYGLLYTFSYSNPLLYGASSHQFVGANGPALGSGQNIAPVWVSAGSGFVGYGFYRTDDTNGGWLFGTSGVAVGDFAIYQNQGAGLPARRLSIGTSGAVDVPGALTTTALTINTGAATVGYVWTATSTGGAGSWQAAAAALPVTDTTGIAKGSSDATKIVRFEVDGFTTGTTRVLTPPNADATIAGLNVTQTFVNPQTVAIASVQNQLTLSQTNSTATYDPACLVLASTDTVTSTIYGAARVCAGYESASFTNERVAIQTATGSGTYQDVVTFKNQVATFAGDLTATVGTFSFNNGTMDGTMKPLFSGNGSIGAASYRYGNGYFSAANITASGFTLADTTTVGYCWIATSTGGEGAWTECPGGQWTTSGSNIYRSTGVVSIGTTTAGARLLVANQSTIQTATSGTALHLSGADSVLTRFLVDTFGAIPSMNFRRANGTAATPSALAANDIFLNLTAIGYGTSAYSSGGRVGILGYAAQAWTNSAQGSYLAFGTTSNGSTSYTDRWRVAHDGHILSESDGSYDIGATGANRVRNMFMTGGITAAGNFSFQTLTLSGSLVMGATTVINASRNMVGLNTFAQDILFAGGSAYNVGSSGAPPLNVYGNYIEPLTELVMGSGTVFRGSLIPATNNTDAIGNTSFRVSNVATVNANISGTITTPSGSAGITSTKTVRDSAGTGTCTLIFSGGILTGGTC